MDQKNTLIVVISITLVVFVVVGVALWLFNPRTPSIASSQTFQSVQGIGADASPSASPSPTASPDASPMTPQSVVSPSPTAGGSDQIAASPSPGTSPLPGEHNSQQVVIVYGSNPSAQIGPDGRLLPATPLKSPAPGVVASPSPSAVPSASPSPSPSSTAVATSARQASPKPRATIKPTPPGTLNPGYSGKQYWIQVISSPDRDRVEQIRKDLATLGFNGVISPRSVNGRDFYRLRYGPYTIKAEADKFLSWVKVLKGFEASYISEDGSSSGK